MRRTASPSPGRIVLAWLAALLTVLASGTSQAKSHLWRFTEVFSDASGSVQFIEMFVFDPAGTAETKLAGFHLTSAANDYVFTHNLPNENTFQRWILIATQPFADLPGAPVPDYIIPENFFDPAGDELVYRNMLDIFVIASGALPTDGVHSLLIDASTPINSPTNFAGVEGSVNVGGALVPALDTWALAVLVTLVGATFVVFARRGRSSWRGAP